MEVLIGSSLKTSNKPDFFIVGAPKCGTTALYTYLKQHPEIFISPKKEPQFFASDVLGDRRHTCTWSDYLSCFAAAHGEKRIGEASVAYLGSRCAPKEIKAFNPAAKIIIMLRNPVDMMHSLHSQRLVYNTEYCSFDAALDAEERQGLVLARYVGLSYREAARYPDKVRRYFDVFGRENVHVIVYDDLVKDTCGVYRKVVGFLGVGLDFQPRTFPIINANKRVRNRQLYKFLTRPPEVARNLSRVLLPRPLRLLLAAALRRLNTVYEERPPMSLELRSRLQAEFRPEVEELSNLLDRDLSAWCKRELDPCTQ
jgi:hypothetical protein